MSLSSHARTVLRDGDYEYCREFMQGQRLRSLQGVHAGAEITITAGSSYRGRDYDHFREFMQGRRLRSLQGVHAVAEITITAGSTCWAEITITAGSSSSGGSTMKLLML